MSNITMRVEPREDATILEVSQDAIRVAQLLNIPVEFNFNSIPCIAFSWSDPKAIEKVFRLDFKLKESEQNK